jgi:hypothetical protein
VLNTLNYDLKVANLNRRFYGDSINMYKINLNEKITSRKKNNIKRLSSLLLCIGCAFTFGNVFGIYTKSFTNPYVFVFCVLCFIESISFFKYSKYSQSIQNNFFLSTLLSTYLNAAKRGFLIGLFVEAFKVGS